MVSMSLLGLLVALSGLVVFSQAGAAPVQDHVDRYIRNQLLDSVVRVSSESGGKSQDGFGFVFGRAGNTIWIATAGHVIFPEFGNTTQARPKPAANIQIWRHDDPRVWTLGGEPELGLGADLAFLPVRMPPSEIGVDLWRQRVVVPDPQVGEPVWIAGKPGEISFDVSGGQIANSDSSSTVVAVGLRGEEGQSGAPVVTARGIVGMYVQSAGNRIVPISIIRDAALQANRPWQLGDVEPPATAVHLCVRYEGSNALALQINGPAGIRSLDDKGCTNTLSGANIIVAKSSNIQCTPASILLARDSEQEVSVKCFVDPQGVWRSVSYGFLQVAQGDRRWAISGLPMLPYGEIVGTLRGEPPDLWVDARAWNGLVVNGTVRLEARRLHGRLIFGGTPVDIEVTR